MARDHRDDYPSDAGEWLALVLLAVGSAYLGLLFVRAFLGWV